MSASLGGRAGTMWRVLVGVALAVLALASLPPSSATAQSLPTAETLDRLCKNVRAVALLDAAGGEPLYLHEAEKQLQPASTVKLMLLLVAAEAIQAKDLSLDGLISASRRAFNTGGQQIYVAEGDAFTIEDVALATAIHSANDAAVMLAEGVFGSYERAVSAMNARAAEIGLPATVFHSPHGLPESWGHHGDRSSALDLALLGRAAVGNELVRRWCGTPRFDLPGRDLTLVNSNEMLGKVSGVIGLKTGFTQAARFCFIGAAERDGRTLVCAILGAPSSRERFRLAEALFDYGFGRTHRRTVVEEGAPLALRPVEGDRDPVALVAAETLEIAIEPDRIGMPAFHVAVSDTLRPPLRNGEVVGDLVVMVGNHIVGRLPMKVDRSVSVGLAQRLIDGLAFR